MIGDLLATLLEGAITIVVEALSHRSEPTSTKRSLERKAELDALLKYPKELQRLLREHQKIQAIKLYKEETKASLKEAKMAVEMTADEMLVAQYEAQLRRRSSTALEEIRHCLETGSRLHAIKVYRKSTGVGLKESKNAVDLLAVKWGLLQ